MTCPTCGRDIDPLRAPVARVVGARVVTYCSLACKDGLEAVPLAEPEEPEVTILREGDITPVPEPTAPTLIAAVPAKIRRPRVGLVVGLVGAAILAGLAALLMIIHNRAPDPTPVAAAAIAAAPPPPPPAPEPPRVDRGVLLEQARAALRAALGDPSPRVRLLAATALSRAGDPAAVAELRAALERDPSEIRRLEVAYALARADQTAGRDYLVEALRSGRRDVRLEAARALARLKDPRGGDRLREALDVVQLRLGAAENLAALGDQQALAILRDALAGGPPESRMRAAVALGRAGDPAARELLAKIVADERLEIGAEDALARLGDRGAVPALVRALGLSAVRVQAAIGLRRLAVEVDLAVLAGALETGDDLGRISAAEAVLVLLLPTPPPELK